MLVVAAKARAVKAAVTEVKAAGVVGLVSSRHICRVVPGNRGEVAVAEAAGAADWETEVAETEVAETAVGATGPRILDHPAEEVVFQRSKEREAAHSLAR